MEILSRAVGRRKEAVAQVQIVKGTGKFTINNIPANQYLQNNTCSIIEVKAPFNALGLEYGETSLTPVSNVEQKSVKSEFKSVDTIVKVKGGGLIGQAEAIKLALARALCNLDKDVLSTHTNAVETQTSVETQKSSSQTDTNSNTIIKVLKDKGYLTQDSRVKERRKYGLKKARKASQYHKR